MKILNTLDFLHFTIRGSLVLPHNLIEIKETVFYGCSGFTGNLVIPQSVNEIGKEAFFSTHFEKVVFNGK